jgi:uncharacterized protein with GYD domain
MPTYISLCNFTDQGIKAIKESPARLEAVKGAFKAMGGEMKAFFLVMGEYDMVVIGEVPDDATVAKLALSIGSGGAIRTKTLRAYTEEEYKAIIAGLP